MKKLKYILLVLFIIPIVALAEPIHLNQDAINEIFSTPNVLNETYEVLYNNQVLPKGLDFRGGEYILDGDIDLHNSNIISTTGTITFNLNGHNITNEQLDDNNRLFYPTIGNDGTIEYDVTINGPGTIKYNTYISAPKSAIMLYGGTLRVNNATIEGIIKTQANSSLNFDYTKVYLNNTIVTDGLEIWGGELYIDGCTINQSDGNFSTIRSDNTSIINTTITSPTAHGFYLKPNGDHGVAVIKNSSISAKEDAIWIQKYVDLTIENTFLSGFSGLYIQGDPKITLSDIHYKADPNLVNPEYAKMIIVPKSSNDVAGVTSENIKAFFERYLKEGYIYWNNLDFIDDTVYNNLKVGRDEGWIIKQQEEYEAEEQTYEIPEDNEVIIKVSGYKFLFEKLIINDQEVPDTDYEILDTDGDKDVSIKIKNDYLKTLEANKYDIEVVFTNGSATTTLNVVDEEPVSNEVPEVKGEVENPKTGLFNYMILLLPLAIVGIVYIVISKKTYFKGM